jgi:hypothetical protein
MSKYDDGKSLFLSPKVTQYDGHMIMTNVTKPTKTKYVSLDTSYREEFSNYDASATAVCSIQFPERITEVRSISVRNVEMPVSFYNISAAIGNNSFQIVSGGSSSSVVVIPDGQYTNDSLATKVNAVIQTLSSPFKNLRFAILTNSKSYFDTSNGTLTVNFAVNSNGALDAYNFKKKLGWALGFRNSSYDVSTSRTLSEAMVDLSGFRYLYLVLDEFTRGNQNSFLAALPSSLVRKTILAKITIDQVRFPFGSILTANERNGYLLSDTRTYPGTVDLQKMSIQLVDDTGKPISLNGLDFSFCLEVEHE